MFSASNPIRGLYPFVKTEIMDEKKIEAKGKVWSIKDRNSFTKFMRDVIGIQRAYKQGSGAAWTMSEGYITYPPQDGVSSIYIQGPTINKNANLIVAKWVEKVSKLCDMCGLEYELKGDRMFNIKF